MQYQKKDEEKRKGEEGKERSKVIPATNFFSIANTFFLHSTQLSLMVDKEERKEDRGVATNAPTNGVRLFFFPFLGNMKFMKVPKIEFFF